MSGASDESGLQGGRKIAVLLVVTFVIVGAVVLFRPMSAPDAKPAQNSAIPQPENGQITPESGGTSNEVVTTRLAVVPFADQSTQRGQEYLASGMAEELVNRLVKDARFNVTTRPFSVVMDDALSITSADLARFDVDAIVQGTSTKSDDQISLSVQLTDTASGLQLWAKEYQRTFSDVLAIANDIEQAIGQSLGGAKRGDRAEASPATNNVEAFQQFLKGRHLFQARGESLIAARDALESAVELDPQYADACAWLAATLLVTPDYIQDGSRLNTRAALHQKAKAAADEAVKLDQTNAMAHAVLGQLAGVNRQWVSAEKALSKAVAIDPYNALFREWRGDLYLDVGHTIKARDDYAMATDIDPLNSAYQEKLGYALLANADYEAAEAAIQQALKMRRQSALLPLALLRMSTGERTKARELMERYVEMQGYSLEGRAISLYLDSIDGPDRGKDIYQVIQGGLESGRKFPNFVILLATIGRFDESLELASKQNLEMVPGFPANLWLPIVKGMVQKPAFLNLAEQMGFNAYWRTNGYPDNCRREDADPPYLHCND